MIVLIEVENLFDKIWYLCMIKFSKLVVGGNFINLINCVYKKFIVNIKFND